RSWVGKAPAGTGHSQPTTYPHSLWINLWIIIRAHADICGLTRSKLQKWRARWIKYQLIHGFKMCNKKLTLMSQSKSAACESLRHL
ncbi:MAG TPA: hypothetical protein VFA48_01965, partial [Gammaproteobacteria bacterium]|nr:hypothetical protein [Gammaproteobacteria bacterium]